MFLNRLEKEEKIAFLELAHYVARSDNDFSLSQKDIINNYCIEMQIENIEFNVNKFDIYNTLGKITNKKSQKIVLLEIMALIYSDNFLHEEERKVLEKILEEFNLNYHLATVYGEWAKAILSLYIQGNALVEL
jgi:uncharacterized tellurite resistance protein B-like protein